MRRGPKEVLMACNRREFVLLTVAAAASAAAPRVLAERGTVAALYRRSILIDGLGGPSSEEGPLSPRHLEEVSSSGVTAFHLTVGAVGTMPPLEAFEKI